MHFKLLSKLPLNILYAFARIIYFVLYYIIRYRRKLVFEHLGSAFPDLNEQEVRAIAKDYYRNIADVAVELIKAADLPEQEIQDRVKHRNFEMLESLVEQGQSFVLLAAHSCNWDWLQLSLSLNLSIPLDGVYKPLHSKGADRYFYEMRSRFGCNLIKSQDFMQSVLKKKRQQRAYAIIADQKPKGSDKCHITTFLNRETRFFIGPEKIAHFTRAPVIFLHMKRIKRGYYEVECELLGEPPYKKDKDHYPVTERYARAVESQIRENPECWLWSNRRWRVRKAATPAA